MYGEISFFVPCPTRSVIRGKKMESVSGWFALGGRLVWWGLVGFPQDGGGPTGGDSCSFFISCEPKSSESGRDDRFVLDDKFLYRNYCVPLQELVVAPGGDFHMADIVALPKSRRLRKEQADAFRQLAFEFALPDEVRAEIDNAIYKLTEETGERWLFVKISPSAFKHVVEAIHSCAKPATTMAVWIASLPYIRQDTGEILATREQLASDAHALPCHVSTAMTELTRIGAILRHHRGRRVVYSINPNVGWNGGEGTRQTAAKEAPLLRLVSNRDEESPI